MKEIEKYDLEILEREYFDNHNIWRIEEEILLSFKKNGFKKIIYEMEDAYLKLKIPYIKDVCEKIISKWWDDLNDIERFFIKKIEYYFNGGFELEMNKQVIKKFESFYNVKYVSSRKNAKYKSFDINSISIIDVIWLYMKVPFNLNRNLLCPLHKEKTPSFKIFKNTNSYYCFWCHSGGNVVNFISDIDNIEKKEAYKKIINLYSN